MDSDKQSLFSGPYLPDREFCFRMMVVAVFLCCVDAAMTAGLIFSSMKYLEQFNSERDKIFKATVLFLSTCLIGMYFLFNNMFKISQSISSAHNFAAFLRNHHDQPRVHPRLRLFQQPFRSMLHHGLQSDILQVVSFFFGSDVLVGW